MFQKILSMFGLNPDSKVQKELDHLDQVLFEQSTACANICLAICALSWALFYTFNSQPNEQYSSNIKCLITLSAILSLLYVGIKLFRHIYTIIQYRKRIKKMQDIDKHEFILNRIAYFTFYIFCVEMFITVINFVLLFFVFGNL